MTDRPAQDGELDNAPLWIALLTAGSVVATAAFACRVPFAALAVLAALRMRRGAGLAMVAMVWASGQVAGFTLLGYPHDPATIGWGLATGVGAMAAMLAARAVTGGAGTKCGVGRIAAALMLAFATFKLVIAGAALKLGGLAMLVSPGLLTRQLPREAAALAMLLLAYHLLVRAGLPRAGAQGPQLA